MQSKQLQIFFLAGTLFSSEVAGIKMFAKFRKACEFNTDPKPESEEPQPPSSSDAVREYVQQVKAEAASKTSNGMFQNLFKRSSKKEPVDPDFDPNAMSPATEDTTPVPIFDEEPVIPLRYTITVEQLPHTNWCKRFFGYPFGWREQYTAQVNFGADKKQFIFRYSEKKNEYEALKKESPEFLYTEFPEKPSGHSGRVSDMHNIFNRFFKNNPEVTEALFPIDGHKSLLSVLKEMEEEHEKLQLQGQWTGPVKVAISNFREYIKQEDVNDEDSKRISRIVHKFKTVTLMVMQKDSILKTFLDDMSNILGESPLMTNVKSQVDDWRRDLFQPFFNYLSLYVREKDWDSLSNVLVYDLAKEDIEAFESNYGLTQFRECFSEDNKKKMTEALVELQGKVLVELEKLGKTGMDELDPEVLQDLLGKNIDWTYVSKYSKFSQSETWPQTQVLDDKIQQLMEFLGRLKILSDNEGKMKTLPDLQIKVWKTLEQRCPEKMHIRTGGLLEEGTHAKLNLFLGKNIQKSWKHFRDNLDITDSATWPQPSFSEDLDDKIKQLEEASLLGRDTAEGHNLPFRTQQLVEQIMRS